MILNSRRKTILRIVFVILFYICLIRTADKVQAAILSKENAPIISDGTSVYIVEIIPEIEEEVLNIEDQLKIPVRLQFSDQTVHYASEVGESLIWTSQDPAIAKVSSNGSVTAKGPGTTVINVRTMDGKCQAQITLTVKKPYLTEKTLTLYVDESYWLYVRNGNGKIQWKSSNTAIAKVSDLGKVTVKKDGDVTITAIRSGVTMKCKITVKKLRISQKSLELYEAQDYKLSIMRTQKTVEWKSSDFKIATVSSKGTVTAKKKGTVRITGTVAGKKYTCEMKVMKSNIFTGKKNISMVKKGKERIKLTCELKDWKNVYIKISNSAVLSYKLENQQGTKAELVILPLKQGTTELSIYHKSKPSDVKTIKISVSKEAISKAPNIKITMSGTAIGSTAYGKLKIENLGAYKLKLMSRAFSYDFNYSGYDRVMNLISPATSNLLDTLEIGPGVSKDVTFKMEGNKTCYDRKTKYYIYFWYDGLEYEAITSNFLGTVVHMQ